MIPPEDAIARLREGNRRFVTGEQRGASRAQLGDANVLQGQSPFAVVLGCADSRVPAEIVFDQGFGDLFVVRVAGNVVARSQIGSVEYAVSEFDARLVVVLGHSRCGAVLATLDVLQQKKGQELSESLSSIVDRIRPSVAALLDTDVADDAAALVQSAVRANVIASTKQLRAGSNVLDNRVQDGRLEIVGAEFSLETGQVEFL